MRLAARDRISSTEALNVTVLKLRGLYWTVNKTVCSVLCVLKRVNCAFGNDRHTAAVHWLETREVED